jgi:hypothetical protein
VGNDLFLCNHPHPHPHRRTHPHPHFLSQISKNTPDDLENYVLKPLFSFGGHDVIIDVTQDDIQKIKDPKNWILQQKSNMSLFCKLLMLLLQQKFVCLYFWPDGNETSTLATNFTGLSRG